MKLKDKYEKEIRKELTKEFDIKNSMAIPRLTKIVINMGTQDALKDKGVREKIMEDLATITGQRPQIRPAKISEAGFGIREGNPIGLRVTLRRNRMYDFMQKFVSVALPRLRDFRGTSLKSFDNFGNYSIGVSEHIIFPEIDISKVDKTRGLQVTFVTSTDNVEESKRLLELLGMPFEKEEEEK